VCVHSDILLALKEREQFRQCSLVPAFAGPANPTPERDGRKSTSCIEEPFNTALLREFESMSGPQQH
jgi:hypothetical protein